MTKSNSTSSWVHLGIIQAQHVLAVDCHRGKCFVDLDDVDVVLCQAELLEQLRDGHRWADTHDSRWQASNGSSDELGENGLADFDGFGALHKKNCSG